jgi:DHA1 family bicyclomycin/chloramphenicol resistance-like MFS transporter
MTSSTASRPGISFLAIMALLTSIAALSIDIMLPGLAVMGRDLGVDNINHTTLIITAFFFGMAFGQLAVGPLADSFGRKPVVLGGYALFMLGCLLSMVCESWALMVFARVLQGVAAAAPRVLAVAIVRDQYKGRMMARIMSIIMAVFILIPIIAPLLGQVLIYLGGWRVTFAGLIAVALPTAWWFHKSIAETLPAPHRRPFTLRVIGEGLVQICRSRVTVVYMLAMGFIVGPFIGYLGSARQIFQDIFGVGDMFVIYFAAGSVSAGVASLVNARLVMRHGMRRLTGIAITMLTGLSAGLWGWAALGGDVGFGMFMGWQIATIFCIGMIFGNVQALAMEPLGHIAGLGAAIFGAVSTFVALPLSWMVSGYFDGTIIPLVRGFAVMGGITLVMMLVAGRR